MEFDQQPIRYFTSKSILRQTHLSLKFSIENTETCEYDIKIFELQGQKRTSLFTSDKKTSSPSQTITFPSDITLIFSFHQAQKLHIIITKNGTPYDLYIPLAKLLVSQNNTLQEPIHKDSTDLFSITANEVKQDDINSSNEELINLFLVTSNPEKIFTSNENRFYYEITSHIDECLYRSEMISNNGTFQIVEIPSHHLSPEFKITFLDNKATPIVSFSSTLELFLEPKGLFHYIPFPLNGNVIQVVNYSYQITPYSFIDFISARTQIGTMLALDFTGSNGAPSSNTSLHFIQKRKLNDYERAIHEIGGYLSLYDETQKIPVFGFGARAPGETNVSMCFNLNMKNTPYIEGISNVLKEYRKITPQLYFSGPTHVSQILMKCIEIAKERINEFKYNVLIILTDGNMDDVNETKELLVKTSAMPISVVVIGIGKGSFNLIEDIVKDESPMVSKKGLVSRRRNIVFVKVIEYKNDWGKIVNDVLYQIPRQFIDYCSIYNVSPSQLK